MWFQQYERYEILQIVADIIGFILKLFQPIVTPIGTWMVSWVDVLLKFFPTNSLAPYVAIFILLVVSGIIVNLKWPGEKYIAVFTKEDSERDSKEEKKSNIDFHEDLD